MRTMSAANREIMIHPLAFFFLIFFFVTAAEAGSKGKLIGALADYEDYKMRTFAILQEADDNRAQHYSTDPKELMMLFKEVSRSSQKAHAAYGEERATEIKSRETNPIAEVWFMLHTALDELGRAILYEATYQIGQKTPFILLMRAKAEDMFRTADEELKSAKATIRK